MRDAQTFEIERRIEREIVREISREQIVILRLKTVEGQRVAAFFDGVNDFLELSEHRLSKKRAANVVDLPIDDVSAHFRIAGLLEEMMGEQFLVKGGGDLRQKNRVIVILIFLRFLREPTVHRMPGFMRQGVNVREYIFLVVH